ncbi:MAG TPA: hypothetical protein VMR17_04115 [Xanthobacteraceae bacterium]|nr:hypothetical protein [Xanthobacteraceae bacterium]
MGDSCPRQQQRIEENQAKDQHIGIGAFDAEQRRRRDGAGEQTVGWIAIQNKRANRDKACDQDRTHQPEGGLILQIKEFGDANPVTWLVQPALPGVARIGCLRIEPALGRDDSPLEDTHVRERRIHRRHEHGRPGTGPAEARNADDDRSDETQIKDQRPRSRLPRRRPVNRFRNGGLHPPS